GRHKHKRKHATGERLGVVAKLLMNPAAPLLAQKDATAILTIVDLVLPRPPGTALQEDRHAADLRILVPPLGLDAAALFLGNADDILLAAVAADMTVPILHDRQVTNGKRHGLSGRIANCSWPAALSELRPQPVFYSRHRRLYTLDSHRNCPQGQGL